MASEGEEGDAQTASKEGRKVTDQPSLFGPPRGRHTCPVCEYDQMTHPPKDYMICPRCGTEFGNDDTLKTHEELRAAWEAKGRPWFRKVTK